MPEPKHTCQKCDGCGQVATSDDEEPWSVWMNLPLQSAVAVVLGLVKPKTCPTCNGTGQAAAAANGGRV